MLIKLVALAVFVVIQVALLMVAMWMSFMLNYDGRVIAPTTIYAVALLPTVLGVLALLGRWLHRRFRT